MVWAYHPRGLTILMPQHPTSFTNPAVSARISQVKPLRAQLKTLQAWITGQRKDQSPGTRMAVPVVEVDPVFEGAASGPGSLVKYNPLSNVTSAEVWNFLRVMVSGRWRVMRKPLTASL